MYRIYKLGTTERFDPITFKSKGKRPAWYSYEEVFSLPSGVGRFINYQDVRSGKIVLTSYGVVLRDGEALKNWRWGCDPWDLP